MYHQAVTVACCFDEHTLCLLEDEGSVYFLCVFNQLLHHPIPATDAALLLKGCSWPGGTFTRGWPIS